MRKISEYFFILVIMTVLFACFYVWFIPRTAYVKVDEVYNSFPLKVELEKQLQTTQKEREKIMDSLKTDLKLLSMKIEAEKSKNVNDINLFYLKRDQLAEKEERFLQDTEAQMQNYKDQIWKQLNQYIKDFGTENGYDYIFGVDDSYQMLFYKERHNITSEMKKFVNGKYEGVRK